MDLLLIYFWLEKNTSTRCHTGNVSGRFKLISISSSDDFIQAGVEERAACHQRDSSLSTVTQKPAADLWATGRVIVVCGKAAGVSPEQMSVTLRFQEATGTTWSLKSDGAFSSDRISADR